MKKVSLIFGTRPEAIKLCPLVLALKNNHDFQPHVCVTAQHRELLDDVLDVFGIKSDTDLDLMQANQALPDLTCRAISALDKYLSLQKPDFVLVQGDTTTTFCAALTAFYHQIPIGHIEAGLRTWNNSSPFPEEANRVLTTHLTSYHFTPTYTSKENLQSEGIPENRIFVTGNTAIDTLKIAIKKIRKQHPEISSLPPELLNGQSDMPLVLITSHRRENFGSSIKSICRAINTLAKSFPEVAFVYPVHMNPNIAEPVHQLLNCQQNLYLIKPLGYLQFVAMMIRSTVILTDSGGIQEEAPTLGKPVLIMRDTTERQETVKAGTARLIGTSSNSIVENVSELLTSDVEYGALVNTVNPYGDGHACDRIVEVMQKII